MLYKIYVMKKTFSCKKLKAKAIIIWVYLKVVEKEEQNIKKPANLELINRQPLLLDSKLELH